jgi:hypothetical protein
MPLLTCNRRGRNGPRWTNEDRRADFGNGVIVFRVGHGPEAPRRWSLLWDGTVGSARPMCRWWRVLPWRRAARFCHGPSEPEAAAGCARADRAPSSEPTACARRASSQCKRAPYPCRGHRYKIRQTHGGTLGKVGRWMCGCTVSLGDNVARQTSLGAAGLFWHVDLLGNLREHCHYCHCCRRHWHHRHPAATATVAPCVAPPALPPPPPPPPRSPRTMAAIAQGEAACRRLRACSNLP